MSKLAYRHGSAFAVSITGYHASLVILNAVPLAPRRIGIDRERKKRVWIKLDDGFATHPKIIQAGPMALALQVRAICYASQQRTDGFLSAVMLPYLLIGFPTDQDWPSLMTQTGLWDRQDGGYAIHDYLQWNVSKKDYETWKKKLSIGGRRGMKSRWNKENTGIASVITKDITRDVTVSSTATATLSSLQEGPNWFEKLRVNPLYAHVDFDKELAGMQRWKLIPKNRNRVINERFVINWLNKIDQPLPNGHGISLTCDKHPHLTFADKQAKDLHDFTYHPKFVG